MTIELAILSLGASFACGCWVLGSFIREGCTTIAAAIRQSKDQSP